MAFLRKNLYVLLGFLIIAQKCIAVYDAVHDDRVSFVPDVYVEKTPSDGYEFSLDIVDELMLYASENLMRTQCMAILLDHYNYPEKAGFITVFRKLYTPPEEYTNFHGRKVKVGGTTANFDTSSPRFLTARPICSICKEAESDVVSIGPLTVSSEGQRTDVFVLSPIIGNPRRYTINFHIRQCHKKGFSSCLVTLSGQTYTIVF